MTYLNTQQGVAESFLKDVKDGCAGLLKDPSAKTIGMVNIDCRGGGGGAAGRGRRFASRSQP